MRALFTAPRIPKFTGWQYHWDYNGENIQSLRMDSTCGLCGLEESTADTIVEYLSISSSWTLYPTKKVLGFFLQKFKEKKA